MFVKSSSQNAPGFHTTNTCSVFNANSDRSADQQNLKGDLYVRLVKYYETAKFHDIPISKIRQVTCTYSLGH